MKKFALLFFVFFVFCASGAPVEEPEIVDPRNLLVNPGFEFYSLIPHRHGRAQSFAADYVPFWNADTAKSLRVRRDSHIDPKYLPPFSVPGGVELLPGQSFHQFFTLPEADLLYGEAVSLTFRGWQSTPGAIKGELEALKIESADGTWSPGRDFGFKDKRTFSRMARGELVVAASKAVTAKETNRNIEFKIENFVIPGNFTPGKKSFAKDNNTVGIEVRFTNTSRASVWIFAPSLLRGPHAYRAIGTYRKIPEYYRHIPRTMQKLWKGEAVHILLMGSSIDRGSANPALFPYVEDPRSPKYKQPLSDNKDFSAKLVGRPDLESCFAWACHYHSCAGRLKIELMKKFDLPGDKILLNFMARDGSCVGESHSGLRKYCELQIPPDPEANGHRSGKSWRELYPGLFSRPEGPRPDLVIYGSGANEKTDTPDEAAVFEGAIRYIQRNWPGTEFVGCIFQSRKGYTPNGGDMQAIAMRYGIPYIDFGLVNDRLTRLINPNAAGNGDEHPQAAIHYIWFKQLEKAFECAGPVVAGFPQAHLPERMMSTTLNWEGEMKLYRMGDKRFFRPRAFILDDSAFNCWAQPDPNADPKGLKKIPGSKHFQGEVFVDGVCRGRPRWPTRYDLRNSFSRYGRLSFGDRHVIEVNPAYVFNAVDAKRCLNRNYIGVESGLFSGGAGKALPCASKTGFPYGRFVKILAPGESCTVTFAGTACAPVWVDTPKGGTLQVDIDGKKAFELATDQPFILKSGEKIFMENRKGLQGLPYGVHTVTFKALKGPVTVMGLYGCDLRSNRANERVVRNLAADGVYVFEPAFKATPLIRCSPGLTLKSATPRQAVFAGSGRFEAVGE